MQVGDLVRIPKARIGVPANSLGLIIACGTNPAKNLFIYEVQLVQSDNRVARRLERDLEVVKCKSVI